MTMIETIPTDTLLSVPSDVQLCPYCGAKLCVQFDHWQQEDDGTWIAANADIECVAEPDGGDGVCDTQAWQDWNAKHSQLLYVYWMPASIVVLKWVNANYRFAMNT